LSLVFVSSVEYDANFGFLMAADEACGRLAADAGLPGGWAAWLSDDDMDAKNRINNAKYVLIDGTPIANNMAELLDGALDAPIQVDENGDTLSGAPEVFEVWTGTDTNGTNSVVGNCDNWTSNSSTAQSGRADAMDATWTEAGEVNCDDARRLYCFGFYSN
jgi:hypothetical protein